MVTVAVSPKHSKIVSVTDYYETENVRIGQRQNNQYCEYRQVVT